jgi:hypothetical protein
MGEADGGQIARDMVCSLWASTVANPQGLFSRYCIPMDNDRPELEIRYFKDICPNKDGTSRCNFRNWD